MLFMECLESIAITIEGNDSYSKATLNMEFRITIRIALVVFIMKYSLGVNINLYHSLVLNILLLDSCSYVTF